MKKFNNISVGLSALLAIALVIMSISEEPPKPLIEKTTQPNSKKPIAKVMAKIFVPPLSVQLPPPPMPPAPKQKATLAKSVTKPAAKPIIKPAVKPISKPKPIPKVRPIQIQPAEPEIKATSVAEGRALLRLLEHGKGPSIEIAWPASRRDRQRLYGIFTSCFGMRTALMDDRQRLFTDSGARGQMWRPDFDRFSGYMRQAAGLIPLAEQQEISSIERHHGGIDGVIVRLFPRRIDAVILGGLRQATENGYQSDANIRARYAIQQGEIIISKIQINGRPVAGRFNLSRLIGKSAGRCVQT